MSLHFCFRCALTVSFTPEAQAEAGGVPASVPSLVNWGSEGGWSGIVISTLRFLFNEGLSCMGYFVCSWNLVRGGSCSPREQRRRLRLQAWVQRRRLPSTLCWTPRMRRARSRLLGLLSEVPRAAVAALLPMGLRGSLRPGPVLGPRALRFLFVEPLRFQHHQAALAGCR